MKLFAIILFIAMVAAVRADYPKEADENDNKIIEACLDEHKLTEEEYKSLRHGKTEKADENMQCFANCFMEKAGFLKDNKLQEDVATQVFTKKVGEEKAKKILTACKGESGSGKCETAYKLHLCFLKNEAY